MVTWTPPPRGGSLVKRNGIVSRFKARNCLKRAPPLAPPKEGLVARKPTTHRSDAYRRTKAG